MKSYDEIIQRNNEMIARNKEAIKQNKEMIRDNNVFLGIIIPMLILQLACIVMAFLSK